MAVSFGWSFGVQGDGGKDGSGTAFRWVPWVTVGVGGDVHVWVGVVVADGDREGVGCQNGIGVFLLELSTQVWDQTTEWRGHRFGFGVE